MDETTSESTVEGEGEEEGKVEMEGRGGEGARMWRRSLATP